jgi:hypothetical protein
MPGLNPALSCLAAGGGLRRRALRDLEAVSLLCGAHDITAQASAAWEAAVCRGDEYAVKRLAEIRAV